jgi:hypothetical protein
VLIRFQYRQLGPEQFRERWPGDDVVNNFSECLHTAKIGSRRLEDIIRRFIGDSSKVRRPEVWPVAAQEAIEEEDPMAAPSGPPRKYQPPPKERIKTASEASELYDLHKHADWQCARQKNQYQRVHELVRSPFDGSEAGWPKNWRGTVSFTRVRDFLFVLQFHFLFFTCCSVLM